MNEPVAQLFKRENNESLTALLLNELLLVEIPIPLQQKLHKIHTREDQAGKTTARELQDT